MKWKETFLEVVYAIVPIAVIISILHFTIAGVSSEVYIRFLISVAMVIAGLFLFLIGSRIGVVPVGRLIGAALVEKGRLWMLLFFAFLIGLVVTLAEPDVQVLASQVDAVSGGSIPKLLLLFAVAAGVGIFLLLSMLRLVFKIPLLYLLAGSYLLALVMAFFTPESFVAVSFDSGGVTTGPMTVPFMLALGVGVASVMGDRASADKSFGLVAMASIGPILAVQILGVIFG